MARAIAAVFTALAAIATVVVVFAEPVPLPREAGRAAALTWDTFHFAWNECASQYEFALGTSTSVHTDIEGERMTVEVSGSPADGPLGAALQSCLDRYRFRDSTGAYIPWSPLEQLLVAVYRDSIVENCLEARGVDIEPMETWKLAAEHVMTEQNPYFNMSGDAREIAELRRDCPPYPAFLVPDTPVRQAERGRHDGG